MSYVYHDPLLRGYKKFKLTKKQHNLFFPKRKYRWYDKFEYYFNENQIIFHRFYNWKFISLMTLAFPLLIIFAGVSNIKEVWDDFLKLYNQKDTGWFSSESVSKKNILYNEIIEKIK